MSRLSMVCVALMTATSLFAESNDTFDDNNFAADSANARIETESAKSYHFGRREVIFDDNGIHFLKDRSNFDSSFDDDDQRNPYRGAYYGNSLGGSKTQETNNGNQGGSSPKKPKKHRYFSPDVVGAYLGVAQLASSPLSLETDYSVNYLDLNRGFQLGICADAVGLPIIDRHLGICVGVGAKCDIYTFSTKNLVLEKGRDHLIYHTDTTKLFKKSKLTNTFLTVPAVVEVHARGLSLIAGVEGNLLVWSNTKMKATSGHKDRVHSDFYQNLFSYNLLAQVTVSGFGAYVRANMSPMFKKDRGPEIYQFSAGLSASF